MAASNASTIAALISAASSGVRAARNAHEPPGLEADDVFQSLLDTTRNAFRRRSRSPRPRPAGLFVTDYSTDKLQILPVL